MRILSRSTLRNFWESHPDAEEALKTWYYEASHADWQSPVDVKAAHGNASIIAKLLLTTVSYSTSKAILIGSLSQFVMISVLFLSGLLALISSMTR